MGQQEQDSYRRLVAETDGRIEVLQGALRAAWDSLSKGDQAAIEQAVEEELKAKDPAAYARLSKHMKDVTEASVRMFAKMSNAVARDMGLGD